MNGFLIEVFGWTGEDGGIACFYLINYICQIVNKKITAKKQSQAISDETLNKDNGGT